MVLTKVQKKLIGGGNSKATKDGFSKKKNEQKIEYQKYIAPLRVEASIQPGEDIKSLEELMKEEEEKLEQLKQEKKEKKEKMKQQLLDSSLEPKKQKTQKRKTENSEDKPAPKKPKNLNYSKRCHQCRKVDGEKEGVAFMECKCKNYYCENCLEKRYDLFVQIGRQPQKPKEDKKDKGKEEESSEEEKEEKEQSKEQEESVPGWLCPACEKICNCDKCRTAHRLTPMNQAVCNKIKDRIRNEAKFSCMYDYFIYMRDEEKGKKGKEEHNSSEEE